MPPDDDIRPLDIILRPASPTLILMLGHGSLSSPHRYQHEKAGGKAELYSDKITLPSISPGIPVVGTSAATEPGELTRLGDQPVRHHAVTPVRHRAPARAERPEHDTPHQERRMR